MGGRGLRRRRPRLTRAARLVHGAALACLAGLIACAARAPALNEPVALDLERSILEATAPSVPLRATFRWNVVEGDGSRFSGEGVARIAPDHLARMDLFGPRGDGYLTAALVRDSLRLPPNVEPGVPVPPSALLWSTIGVVRPPAGAQLVLTRQEGDRTRLEYTHGADRWRYQLDGGRLTRAELLRNSSRPTHSVELRGEARFSLPQRAVYREWAAFRELTLELDTVEQTAGFGPEVWTLDAN